MEKLLELLFISSLKGVGKKTIHKQYFEAIKSCEDINDLEENLLPKIKAFSTIELKTAEKKEKKLLNRNLFNYSLIIGQHP